MDQKAKDLKAIDLLVSTFLITYKDGIQVSKLDQAYYDISGENIPYRKHGFSNLQSLLNVLPSVSMTAGWVKAIPTEKNMHIHEYVRDQKQTTKSARPPPRRMHNNYNYDSRQSHYGGYRSFGGYPSGAYPNAGQSSWQQFNDFDRRIPPSHQNGWDQSSNHWNQVHRPNINKRDDNTNFNGRVQSYTRLDLPKPSTIQKPKESQPILKEKLPKLSIPLSEGAIVRLKMILKMRKSGLSAADISKQYQETFPTYMADLDWRQMEHASLDDLLKTAPTGALSTAYSLGGHIMYFESTDPNLVSDEHLHCTPAPALLPKSVACAVQTLATPQDQYQPLNLKQLLGTSNKINVHMGEVYTPNEFYLNPDTDEALDDVMDNILEYLSSDGKKTPVKLDEISEEMPVIVKHSDGAHYRAKILDVSNPVTVFIVDYGTTCDVTIENVYRIPKEFMTLPIQAFKATLHNVKPSESSESWTTNDAAAWLLEQTSSQFVATIVDRNGEFVKVILHSKDNVQSMNEGMVDANLASYCVKRQKIMETPLEKLAASLKMSSLDSEQLKEGTTVDFPHRFATEPVTPVNPVSPVQSSELTRIKNDESQIPLVVTLLQGQAVTLLQDCLQSLLLQRERCLTALSSNPEREDLFNYVQILYPVIKKLKDLKGDLQLARESTYSDHCSWKNSLHLDVGAVMRPLQL